MKKIEDKSYEIKLGCLKLYCEDLIDIVELIEKDFKKYELRLDDYHQINQKDNIAYVLKKIKNDNVENISYLHLKAYLSDDNSDCRMLELIINSSDSKIYTPYSSNFVIGVMTKLNDILSKRTKKFGNMMKSNHFIIFFGVVFMAYLLSLYLDLLEIFPINIREIFFLLYFIGFFLLCSDFIFKFSKNKIFLFKYNEIPPWYSIKYIKNHTGMIVWTIIIGAIFFILQQYILF